MDCPSTSGIQSVLTRKRKALVTYYSDDSDVSSIADPYADSGSSFCPSNAEETSDESVDGAGKSMQADETVAEVDLEVDTETQNIVNDVVNSKSKKRGPRRKFADKSLWKRNVRKELRNSGRQYTNVKGTVVPAKQFDGSDCRCIKECHKLITIQQRQKIFKNYYELASYDLQTAYLCGQIKLSRKLSTTVANSETRTYTRIYYLTNETGIDIPVCKEFFKKNLSVSDGRLTRALGQKEQSATPSKDKRGKAAAYNKTSEEKITSVTNFITRFPKYQSHYSRKKNPNLCYLPPTLNLSTMYGLYKNETPEPVSLFVFRDVFRKKFNLTFHTPVSDSCKRCDEFEQKIKSEVSEATLAALKCQKELHLRKAECARKAMASDGELGKIPENDVTVIAFDLMSTLPTPHLSTGVCYYKRQLWTYCLGIHNLSNNQAHMYVWHEAIASRGPQEIGSCLMHYIKKWVKTSKLVLYSDRCGGQNRNIKLALMCNYILQNKISTVQHIDHKFLVSGHSYLACDRDFGVIEKNKKRFNDIYVPQDWSKVIKTARKMNPFIVVEMTSKDFVTTVPLEKNITNRKKTVEGDSVNWLKMIWLRYTLAEPEQIYFKETYQDMINFEHIDISKRKATTFLGELPILYPTGREIEPAKYSNLNDLLAYIPPYLHDFYKNLKVKKSVQVEKNNDEDVLYSVEN